MLKPSENIITTPHNSQYSLVIAVAKRAREITQESNDDGKILVEKPVDLAVRDFVAGNLKIIEPDPLSYL
jgi:DNA-directed RNA polymerase subunit omega